MAYNELLADRVRQTLSSKAVPFEEKKMFGGIAFMIRNRMACGIVKEDLMVRVVDSKYEAALEKPHCSVMDFTGRVMKGFLMIGPAGCDADKALGEWLDLGVEYANTAPDKKRSAISKPPKPI
jgi:TfoX N-terminal domain